MNKEYVYIYVTVIDHNQTLLDVCVGKISKSEPRHPVFNKYIGVCKKKIVDVFNKKGIQLTDYCLITYHYMNSYQSPLDVFHVLN